MMTEVYINTLEKLNSEELHHSNHVEMLIDDWRTLTASIKELSKALSDLEIAADKVNGEKGSAHELCLICGATKFDSEVGIVHDVSCAIKKAREVLNEIKNTSC